MPCRDPADEDMENPGTMKNNAIYEAVLTTRYRDFSIVIIQQRSRYGFSLFNLAWQITLQPELENIPMAEVEAKQLIDKLLEKA